MSEITEDKILILGFGKEGQSTYRYLSRHYPNKIIGIADKQKIKNPPQHTFTHTGDGYLKNIFDYDLIIRSPGIPSFLNLLKQYLKSGKKITTPTNIFFANCPGLIIGITGTKGKSTTTSLIAHLLKTHFPDVRLVGNIGKPALDYLSSADTSTIFVMELSCYQLEDIKYSPHIAVILNITPEHLDRYKTFSNYFQAKANIVKHQKPNDHIVYNPRHLTPSRIAALTPAAKHYFSLHPTTSADVTSFVSENTLFINLPNQKPQPLIKTNKLPLLGKGNLENVLAAITTASILKVPIEKIKKALLSFKSLEHRLEFVGEYQGIYFYNDSLATTPEATIHALEALGNKVETLIAGGHERYLDYSGLGNFLSHTNVKNLILFPPTGTRIWESIKQKDRFEKYFVTSMKEAVDIAFKVTSPEKICLLSPASASFGLFRNYIHRGSLFKEMIIHKYTTGTTLSNSLKFLAIT